VDPQELLCIPRSRAEIDPAGVVNPRAPGLPSRAGAKIPFSGSGINPQLRY
jgi:hypothetical protein